MNHEERMIRRLNGEVTLIEKIFRFTLIVVMTALALAVVVVAGVLLVEAVVLGMTIPSVHLGVLWWLIGFLMVSIVVWAVAAR